MDKVKELKEIIIGLKLDLLEMEIPHGHCPYTYYRPSTERTIDCDIDCDKCRKIFMLEMERDIRREVETL